MGTVISQARRVARSSQDISSLTSVEQFRVNVYWCTSLNMKPGVLPCQLYPLLVVGSFMLCSYLESNTLLAWLSSISMVQAVLPKKNQQSNKIFASSFVIRQCYDIWRTNARRKRPATNDNKRVKCYADVTLVRMAWYAKMLSIRGKKCWFRSILSYKTHVIQNQYEIIVVNENKSQPVLPIHSKEVPSGNVDAPWWSYQIAYATSHSSSANM